MRVLYWTNAFWPSIGGIEVVGTQLVSTLKRRGHEVIVLTMKGPNQVLDEETYDGVPVYRFPLEAAVDQRDLKQIHDLVRRIGALRRSFAPDVVHMHVWRSDPILFFNLHTAAAHPCASIITFHGWLDQAVEDNSLLARACRAADHVTAVSNAALEDLLACVPGMAGRVSVVHNGLALPPDPLAPLAFDPPRLLCLGRLVHEKGFDVAIRAMPEILCRYPQARLIVAGDGLERAALERQAADVGVSGAVDLIGFVGPHETHTLIDTATVVVMPSRWKEPFGLVALEAAQRGRPLVATRRGGLPEVVADGETGLLVPSEDAGALAGAVCALLDHPEAARRMGAAARRRAETLFGLDACVDAYETHYRQFVGPATAPRSLAG